MESDIRYKSYALCGIGNYSPVLLKNIEQKYDHFFENLQDAPLPVCLKMLLLRSSCGGLVSFKRVTGYKHGKGYAGHDT